MAELKVYGEDDIDSPKIMFHVLHSTDMLGKYLETCAGEFHFDSFCDFCTDEINNEAVVVVSFDAVGAYDDSICFSVCEYQGLYFVQAHELDDVGFFSDREMAENCAKDIANYYQ